MAVTTNAADFFVASTDNLTEPKEEIEKEKGRCF